MKKILSYCLFEPKFLPKRREWDAWKDDCRRYWFNLPALALVNNILYEEYDTKIYVSPNIWEDELKDILVILQEELPRFHTETVDLDYTLTEPAIWRMKCLWDEGVKIFHTRDLDSLPTEIEYKFTKAFEESSCTLGTIRSCWPHQGPTCRMLAGLSSFKPPKIPFSIKNESFDYYYSMRHDDYGSDQDLMIYFFTQDGRFTQNNFLDLSTVPNHPPPSFPCESETIEALDRISISPPKQQIFNQNTQRLGQFWSGEPIDARPTLVNFLAETNKNIFHKLEKSAILNKFYLQ